jgi:phage gp29-like protein
MRRDSAFNAALERRVHDLLRCPFRISPYSSSDRDREVADAVKRFWPQMATEVNLRQWVESFHLLDFAPGSIDQEVVFDPDGRTWTVPMLRWRNPRYFYWDASRVTWVDISYYGLTDVDVENGRHVLATTWHMGKFGGKAAALGEDWIDKAFARRDFGDWRDLYAWPAIKGIVPAGGSDDNDEKQQYANQLAMNVRNRVIMSQRDAQGNAVYDAEVLKLADPDGHRAFLDIIEYVDRKYQVAFLGGNVSSEVVDQGAKATAVAQLTSEIRMVQADNAALAQVIRDQLIRFFVTLNFGFDVPCPYVGWDVGVAEDNKAFALGLRDFAQFLSNMPEGYVIDNVKELAERYGVRLRQVGEPGIPPNKLTAPTTDAPEKNDRAAHGSAPAKRTIRKIGPSKWRLFSGDGKNLGTFSSLEAAKKHEAQVNYFKSHPKT